MRIKADGFRGAGANSGGPLSKRPYLRERAIKAGEEHKALGVSTAGYRLLTSEAGGAEACKRLILIFMPGASALSRKIKSAPLRFTRRCNTPIALLPGQKALSLLKGQLRLITGQPF